MLSPLLTAILKRLFVILRKIKGRIHKVNRE